MKSNVRRQLWSFMFVLFSNFSASAQSSAMLPQETQKQLNEANLEFTFNGHPVNPLGIRLFSPWISDGPSPASAAIYMNAVVGSTNQFDATYEKDSNGVVYVELKANNHSEGYFSYKHLGVLANGTHVLQTWENEGGTGVWTNLLLVNFAAVSEYQEDGSQQFPLIMKREGSFTLGDRYGGIVKVQPHKIIIGADGHNNLKARTIDFK